MEKDISTDGRTDRRVYVCIGRERACRAAAAAVWEGSGRGRAAKSHNSFRVEKRGNVRQLIVLFRCAHDQTFYKTEESGESRDAVSESISLH